MYIVSKSPKFLKQDFWINNLIMKTRITLILIVLLSNSLYGQKTDYDHVNKREIFLIKSWMDANSGPKINTVELKNIESIELLFGRNYETKDYPSPFNDQVHTKVTFPDGLELELIKSRTLPASYKITSENYKLVLADGKEIKVGMKGDQLERIFPKSYCKRTVYTDPGPKKGKASFIVFFSFIKDEKIYYADEWIIFILSSKDGALEQFFTFSPE
jgi:hypothetical protein